jgi:uncharacterized protein YcbK (DUF882 family)
MDVNKINTNFKRSEFTCKCGCGRNTVDVRLAQLIQIIRNEIGEPVNINSGYRCESYNASIGGAKNSQHTHGKAADITAAGHTPEQIYKIASVALDGNGGLGIYDTWVHIDVRSGAGQRWDKRS